MMDRLEMPQTFSGSSVQRHDAIGEQILPVPVGSIEIVTGGSKWNEYDAALPVHRHLIPVMDAAGGLPSVRRPGFVADFARMRNAMKNPLQLACDHVIRMDVAGGGQVVIALIGRH